MHNGLIALAQEVKHATRSLIRRPGFLVAGVLSLSLGTGAAALVFGVLYAANYRPLLYQDAERLGQLVEYLNRSCAPDCVDLVSRDVVTEWKARTRSWEAIGAAELASFPNDEQLILGARVDSTLFSILGVRPDVGRLLDATDFLPQAPLVAVISNRLWASQYGRSQTAMGASVRLGSANYVIIGVLPSAAAYPERADVWIPMSTRGADGARSSLSVVGRLRPGVTPRAAAAELAAMSPSIAVSRSGLNAERIGTVLPMTWLAQRSSQSFWVLLGVVGASLLITCANLASLALARMLGREREFAVRAALGASQGRLVREMVFENVVVAAAAALVGTAIAFLARPIAERAIAQAFNFPLVIALDPVVIVAVWVVALVVGLGLGVVPRLQLRKGNLQQALREGSATLSRQGGRIRRAVVILEIAIALTLVTGATLLTRTFLQIRNINLGYDADHLILGRLALPREVDPASVGLLIASIRQRLQAVPGVRAVGFWNESYPRSLNTRDTPPLTVEGKVGTVAPSAIPPFDYQVSPGFFEALGLSQRAGRVFREADAVGAPSVAVVNEEAARLWWGETDIIGRRFRFRDGPWLTVVGVVPNTHAIGDAGVFGALQEARALPLTFRPLALTVSAPQGSGPARGLTFIARTVNRPSAAVSDVRVAISRTDATIRIRQLSPLRDAASNFGPLALADLNATLLIGFALFGVLLAVMGIYGVVADAVQRRRHEIGVRLALGATGAQVAAHVAKEGLVLGAVGVALGAVASLFADQVLRSLLFGTDPETLLPLTAAVAFAFGLTTLCASYLPALRAARLDPVVILKSS